MDESIEYRPLKWIEEGELFYLARQKNGRICRIYGPFDHEEAARAGEIWGVPFEMTEVVQVQ